MTRPEDDLFALLFFAPACVLIAFVAALLWECLVTRASWMTEALYRRVNMRRDQGVITVTVLVSPQDQVLGGGGGGGEGSATHAPPSRAASPAHLECAICLGDLRRLRMAAADCGHVFCEACLRRSLAVSRACPTCREPVMRAIRLFV